MFSNRTNWTLAKNQITSRLETLKREGETILDLTESNPTQCGFPYDKDLILKPLGSDKNMVYEPSPRGMTEPREAIALYYQEKGVQIDPAQILITASTSEAYSFIFRLLVNPNEQILTPSPGYPLFEFLISMNDAHLIHYPLVCHHRWRIDFAALKKLLSTQTKAIIAINPNNPTGSLISYGELSKLNQMATANKIAIISDEVFSDYIFENNPKLIQTFSGNQETLTFTLSGISKVLGLPQMKLAWVVVSGPQKLRNQAIERLEVISDTYLSVNTPVQTSLSYWLSKKTLFQKQIMERLRENRDAAFKLTANSRSIRMLASEGGWYLILKLNQPTNEENLVLQLLEKERVFVHPGYFFDFSEEGYLVVSLLVKPDIFTEGLNRILNYINQS